MLDRVNRDQLSKLLLHVSLSCRLLTNHVFLAEHSFSRRRLVEVHWHLVSHTHIPCISHVKIVVCTSKATHTLIHSATLAHVPHLLTIVIAVLIVVVGLRAAPSLVIIVVVVVMVIMMIAAATVK